MKYKVGDKVKIVDKWSDGCHQNACGLMDRWLGKTMTIDGVDHSNFLHKDYYRMKEDNGEWSWFEPAIAGFAYKITLDEFLNSAIQLCIHCKTQEEIEALAIACKKVSVSWWRWYKEDTCCTNVGTYGDVEYFEKQKIQIYEFDEVYIPPIEDKEEIIIVRVENLITATYKKNGKEVDKAYVWGLTNIVDGAHKAIDELKSTRYNGKVVCIDNVGNSNSYTVGKIYQFKDGQLTNDEGRKMPNDCTKIKTFADWMRFSTSKFVEIVE